MSDKNLFADLEIEALSDEDLEAVAGGVEECRVSSCSKEFCSSANDDDDDVIIAVDPC